MTPRKRRRLPDPDRKRGAFATALRALNRRERSRTEITTWLEGRGFGADEIAEAVERLTAAGALDDDRFARCFAADKRDLAGWGEERIAAALIERGIEPARAEEAAAEGYSQQAERASRLLIERGQPLEDDAARNRALGFLTRRGFAYEVAYEAIRGAAGSQR